MEECGEVLSDFYELFSELPRELYEGVHDLFYRTTWKAFPPNDREWFVSWYCSACAISFKEFEADRGSLEDLEKIKHELLEKGWCPHQVHHLSRIHNYKVLKWMTLLNRPNHRLHVHRECSHHRTCIAYNCDPTTYRTQHVKSDCNCSMVAVSPTDLINIIKAGNIPLCSMDQRSDRIRLIPRTNTTKYVAFSHVWADGLENPQNNALPLCQVQRLKAYLYNLRSTLGITDVSFCYYGAKASTDISSRVLCYFGSTRSVFQWHGTPWLSE